MPVLNIWVQLYGAERHEGLRSLRRRRLLCHSVTGPAVPPDLLDSHLVVFGDGGNQIFHLPAEREVIKHPPDFFSP